MGSFGDPIGLNMSSHMNPSWSQGSQNDPCMLSQGPDILLQGYDSIMPSCGIEPRLHARALSRHMGLISPCSITIPYKYIYILAPGGEHAAAAPSAAFNQQCSQQVQRWPRCSHQAGCGPCNSWPPHCGPNTPQQGPIGRNRAQEDPTWPKRTQEDPTGPKRTQ